jgi:predicted nucleic acid-binding protein
MYLLDSNVVIEFCNAKLPLSFKTFIRDHEISISVITRIEIFSSSKIPDSEVINLNNFVSICTVFDHIDKEIIEKTIEIRQKYKTDLPDAIIAATAIIHRLELITRNTKDFDKIK